MHAAGSVVVLQLGVAPVHCASLPHIQIPVVSAVAHVELTAASHIVWFVVLHWHSVPPELQRGFNDVHPEWGPVLVSASTSAVLEQTEQEPSTWHLRPLGQVPRAVPFPAAPSTLHDTHVPRVAPDRSLFLTITFKMIQYYSDTINIMVWNHLHFLMRM